MSMNIFRLVADMSHLISILLLILKIRASKSAAGISLKTQELFLIVFVSRYLDLLVRPFYSLYLTVMKVLFIGLTGFTVDMMRRQNPYKRTYDATQDTYLHIKYAVVPCAVLGFLVTLYRGFGILELFWNFSEFLEAVAILPQLIVLQRHKEVENLTGNYIFLMGTYRALYIVNWIYRSAFEPHYHHQWIAYLCGLVQTGLYSDFIYLFVKSKARGEKISLPT